MKVLFLDIDGVLNSAAFWEQRARAGLSGKAPREEWKLGRLSHSERFIDPATVVRLNGLLRQSGAHLVMSSTWRTRAVRSTRSLVRDMGIRPYSRLIGVTPFLQRQTESGLYVGVERGQEIQAWLNEHFTGGSFVILDDDGDMGPLLPRLVRTDNRVGLTDADVARALALLIEEGA